MSVHDFGKPAEGRRQKQDITVTEDVEAFRADDVALAEVWRIMEAKCAEAGEPSATLTVYLTLARRGTRERHEYEFQSIGDLRRSTNRPDLLREFTLRASSPWGDDYRRIRLSTNPRFPATAEATASDPEWCREAVNAVLEPLRAHRPWYAPVHRFGSSGLFYYAFLGVAAVTLWASLRPAPPLTVWELAAYVACLVLMAVVEFGRHRFLPLAEIRVRRHSASVAAPDWPPAGKGPQRE